MSLLPKNLESELYMRRKLRESESKTIVPFEDESDHECSCCFSIVRAGKKGQAWKIGSMFLSGKGWCGKLPVCAQCFRTFALPMSS